MCISRVCILQEMRLLNFSNYAINLWRVRKIASSDGLYVLCDGLNFCCYNMKPGEVVICVESLVLYYNTVILVLLFIVLCTETVLVILLYII